MNFVKKNAVYLIIAAVFFALIAVPGLKEKIRDQFFPVAKIEQAVSISDSDYNIDLKGINTEDTNLGNFKNKPLFLNFWGTWCPPCRSEWPTIQKLYESRKGKLNFVLIAMEDQEENVRKFLTENHYTVPVYIARSPISDKLLPQSFPTTFVVDRSGHIIMKEEYSRDWMSGQISNLLDAAEK